jgi:hypothetical protein
MVKALVLAMSFAVLPAMRAGRPIARESSVHDRAAIDSGLVEVRKIYQGIESAIRAGALHRVDTTFSCDSESLDYDAHLYADSSGAIRRLDIDVGTEDHGEKWSFYYDAQKRLRFALAKRGAVVGSEQEERVYYAEDRKLLARRISWQHGPHYWFAKLDPVWDPREWKKAACTGSTDKPSE